MFTKFLPCRCGSVSKLSKGIFLSRIRLLVRSGRTGCCLTPCWARGANHLLPHLCPMVTEYVLLHPFTEPAHWPAGSPPVCSRHTRIWPAVLQLIHKDRTPHSHLSSTKRGPLLGHAGQGLLLGREFIPLWKDTSAWGKYLIHETYISKAGGNYLRYHMKHAIYFIVFTVDLGNVVYINTSLRRKYLRKKLLKYQNHMCQDSQLWVHWGHKYKRVLQTFKPKRFHNTMLCLSVRS